MQFKRSQVSTGEESKILETLLFIRSRLNDKTELLNQLNSLGNELLNDDLEINANIGINRILLKLDLLLSIFKTTGDLRYLSYVRYVLDNRILEDTFSIVIKNPAVLRFLLVPIRLQLLNYGHTNTTAVQINTDIGSFIDSCFLMEDDSIHFYDPLGFSFSEELRYQTKVALLTIYEYTLNHTFLVIWEKIVMRMSCKDDCFNSQLFSVLESIKHQILLSSSKFFPKTEIVNAITRKSIVFSENDPLGYFLVLLDNILEHQNNNAESCNFDGLTIKKLLLKNEICASFDWSLYFQFLSSILLNSNEGVCSKNKFSRFTLNTEVYPHLSISPIKLKRKLLQNMFPKTIWLLYVTNNSKLKLLLTKNKLKTLRQFRLFLKHPKLLEEGESIIRMYKLENKKHSLRLRHLEANDPNETLRYVKEVSCSQTSHINKFKILISPLIKCYDFTFSFIFHSRKYIEVVVFHNQDYSIVSEIIIDELDKLIIKTFANDKISIYAVNRVVNLVDHPEEHRDKLYKLIENKIRILSQIGIINNPIC